MTEIWTLLAQTSQPGAPPAGSPPPGGALSMFLPLLAMIGVFYWIMLRGSRKEKKKFQNMLDALKRNDRIQTIGGIRGTVVDVREDEVVVKVDEANNVRMRFSRSAIKEVVGEAPEVKEKK
jgi:preprotein translocase subunit YajC